MISPILFTAPPCAQYQSEVNTIFD